MGDYYTTSEVAELLNVAPTTVTNWANQGLIECERKQFGKVAWRVFKRDYIDQYVREKEAGRSAS